MPWDATSLRTGRLTGDGLTGDGPTGWRVTEEQHVAGGSEESAVQPRWLPDETLVLVSDRSDWWNLYRWSPADGRPGVVTIDVP